MANEIRSTLALQVSKNNLSLARNVTVQSNMAGGHLSFQVQNIGTSAEQLVFAADVATNGYAWMRNEDATNYVDIGVTVTATFYPLLRLKAGEAAIFRLSPGVAVYAKANTAAIDLEHCVIED